MKKKLERAIMEYKDTLGCDVEVGDVIVYPGRLGSALWTNIAVVWKLGQKKRWYNFEPQPVLHVILIRKRFNWKEQKDTYSTRKTAIVNIENAAVVTSTVLGLDLKTQGFQNKLIKNVRFNVLAGKYNLKKKPEAIQCLGEDTSFISQDQ